MTEQPATILMEGGRRQGRTLANAAALKAKVDEGFRVIVHRNGVYFDCIADGDDLTFVALPKRPEGLS